MVEVRQVARLKVLEEAKAVIIRSAYLPPAMVAAGICLCPPNTRS